MAARGAAAWSLLGVTGEYQHRVSFLGVVGALVLRGPLIASGAADLPPVVEPQLRG